MQANSIAVLPFENMSDSKEDEYFSDDPDDVTAMDYNALAEIYAILNEKDKAFEAWKKAILEGWLDRRRNTLYPYFENLKDESEYQKMLNLMQSKLASLKDNIRKKYPAYEICK